MRRFVFPLAAFLAVLAGVTVERVQAQSSGYVPGDACAILGTCDMGVVPYSGGSGGGAPAQSIAPPSCPERAAINQKLAETRQQCEADATETINNARQSMNDSIQENITQNSIYLLAPNGAAVAQFGENMFRQEAEADFEKTEAEANDTRQSCISDAEQEAQSDLNGLQCR
jgi:hypothetical protein